MKKLHRSDFIKEVKVVFPEIRKDINQSDGLLHPEMSVFADLAQSFIDNEDKENLLKCFQIADKYLKEGTKKLVNAIAVSFLEHLNFDDGRASRSWAFDIMTPALKQEHKAVMEYLYKLFKRE
jgi:hypothetical protein